MKRLVLAVLVSGLPLVILAVAVLWPQASPQWLDLPDGRSVRIYAVTYGTNHIVGPPLACSAARLSPFAEFALVQVFGSRMAVQQLKTTTPRLMVWLDSKTNTPFPNIQNKPIINAYLGDGGNFISGENESVWTPGSGAPFNLMFDVFPHRDATITINFFTQTTAGQSSNCGSLRFRNPARQSYPQWQPETLPATKRAGDVEVTLLSLETGHNSLTSIRGVKRGGMEFTHGTDRSDGRNQTVVDLRLHSLSHPDERWGVKAVEVSDATGNESPNTTISWANNDQEFTFMPGLWPSERAWKLKLQIKQVGGFEPGQLFAFKHVPLGAPDETNFPDWTTNVAGNRITLDKVVRRAPNTNGSWNLSSGSTAGFIMPSLTNGAQLDLIGVVFEPGKTNHADGWYETGSQRTYSFRQIPLEANTADFIFAVHQTRTVEFTAQPKLPLADVIPARDRVP